MMPQNEGFFRRTHPWPRCSLHSATRVLQQACGLDMQPHVMVSTGRNIWLRYLLHSPVAAVPPPLDHSMLLCAMMSTCNDLLPPDGRILNRTYERSNRIYMAKTDHRKATGGEQFLGVCEYCTWRFADCRLPLHHFSIFDRTSSRQVDKHHERS